MKVCKALSVIFCLFLTVAVFAPSARADEYDQMTKFTFSEPIEVPGAILPAGTYWFVLADNTSDRNIVQIFSSDWSHLCAIIMTITTYRQNPSGDTEVKFAERPHYEPQALVKWYYPGLLNEHEFLYPRREERELAHDVKLDIIPKG